jgi:hypothetical protein
MIKQVLCVFLYSGALAKEDSVALCVTKKMEELTQLVPIYRESNTEDAQSYTEFCIFTP